MTNSKKMYADNYASFPPGVYPWKTQFNSMQFPKDHEISFLPSNTIPDRSMSVREILDRYARGLPITGKKVPIYDEQNDLPDHRSLDLIDLAEMREEVKEKIADISDKQKKKQQAAHDKEVEEAAAKKLLKLEEDKAKKSDDKSEKSTNNP